MGRHKQQSLLLYNLQLSISLEHMLKELPNPGIKPRSPSLQADSLPAEPQGKPKNTGVGSLSLLQWIFLTQELNQGLLHHRRILYQLSYQGSPIYIYYNMYIYMYIKQTELWEVVNTRACCYRTCSCQSALSIRPFAFPFIDYWWV